MGSSSYFGCDVYVVILKSLQCGGAVVLVGIINWFRMDESCDSGGKGVPR
jgi:hypothetical protein